MGGQCEIIDAKHTSEILTKKTGPTSWIQRWEKQQADFLFGSSFFFFITKGWAVMIRCMRTTPPSFCFLSKFRLGAVNTPPPPLSFLQLSFPFSPLSDFPSFLSFPPSPLFPFPPQCASLRSLRTPRGDHRCMLPHSPTSIIGATKFPLHFRSKDWPLLFHARAFSLCVPSLLSSRLGHEHGLKQSFFPCLLPQPPCAILFLLVANGLPRLLIAFEGATPCLGQFLITKHTPSFENTQRGFCNMCTSLPPAPLSFRTSALAASSHRRAPRET